MVCSSGPPQPGGPIARGPGPVCWDQTPPYQPVRMVPLQKQQDSSPDEQIPKDKRGRATEAQRGPEGPRGHLLGPALHHLGEQGDAVQVDELLGEGDVPRGVGQVLQGLQLGVHAGRLDALVQLDGRLVLGAGTRRRVSSGSAAPYLPADLQERWSDAGWSRS